MHPNRTFAWTDETEMLAFVTDVAFSTIFIAAEGGAHVVHVPVVAHGPRRLRFHIARGNRAAPYLDDAPALLSCTGPDAYISPDWYGTPDRVPTWDYIAVEARGRLRRLSDEELAEQIDALGEVHESRLLPKKPWTRHKMSPGRFEAIAKAIIGYELEIDDLRGTRKLDQNKKEAEREGVLQGLTASGSGAFADLMRAEFAKA